MIRRYFGIALALAVFAFANQPRSANATIIIEASVDGGATWTTLASNAIDSTTISADTTLGNFAITASAKSNSPGTSALSKLLSNTLDIINNDTATHSILIAYGAQDFTKPTTPPSIVVNSHVGGSVVVSDPANLLTFQSYVDQANGLGHLGIPGTYTTGPQAVDATKGSFSSDASTLISPLSATFSISQLLSITLSGGSELNTADNTTLTPTPEPSTLAIAGLGVLGLIGYGIRRRRGA